MPRVPDLPLGLRFFARVESFVAECPRCGHLLMGRSVATKRRGKGVDRAYRREVWNPVAGRAWCGYCHRHYVVGLLLYPAALRTVGKVLIGERRPPDWKPTWQQLCAMRQEASGYFIDEAKGPGDHSNLAVEAACTCYPSGEVRTPCPIHRKDDDDPNS